MGCCCDKKDDGRCSGSSSGGCRALCICLPYEDGYMIAAQVVSIVAFLISWIWWVTFVIGLVCMVLSQVIWCCRQKNPTGLYISVGLSGLAGVLCIVAGFVMIFLWKDKAWCRVFLITQYDDDDDDYTFTYDGCKEGYWAVVSFIVAILWFASSGCIYYFVKSGRHATFEQKLQQQETTNNENIEMGTVQQQQQQQTTATVSEPNSTAVATTTVVAIATTAQPTGTADNGAVAAATARATNADSYVLPDKIDDVA